MNKQTVIQWLKYVAIAAISFFLLLFVLGGLIFSYYAMKAPTLSEKDLVATTSSKIYDNQNNLIADLGAEKFLDIKCRLAELNCSFILTMDAFYRMNYRGDKRTIFIYPEKARGSILNPSLLAVFTFS